MSYDIQLYEPEFLRRAVEEQLGDWSVADPIPSDDRNAAVEWLRAKGYVETVLPWDTGTDRSFRHPERRWGITASVFDNSVAFGVAYGPDSEPAIAAALDDARQLARLAHLAVYDPQTGETEG